MARFKPGQAVSYRGNVGTVEAVDLTPGMVDVRYGRLVKRHSAEALSHAARTNSGRPRRKRRKRRRRSRWNPDDTSLTTFSPHDKAEDEELSPYARVANLVALIQRSINKLVETPDLTEQIGRNRLELEEVLKELRQLGAAGEGPKVFALRPRDPRAEQLAGLQAEAVRPQELRLTLKDDQGSRAFRAADRKATDLGMAISTAEAGKREAKRTVKTLRERLALYGGLLDKNVWPELDEQGMARTLQGRAAWAAAMDVLDEGKATSVSAPSAVSAARALNLKPVKGAPPRWKEKVGRLTSVTSLDARGGKFFVLPDPPRFPMGRSGRRVAELCGNPLDGTIYILALPQATRWLPRGVTASDGQQVVMEAHVEAKQEEKTTGRKETPKLGWSHALGAPGVLEGPREAVLDSLEKLKEKLGYTALLEKGFDWVKDMEGTGRIQPYTAEQVVDIQSGVIWSAQAIRPKTGKKAAKGPRIAPSAQFAGAKRRDPLFHPGLLPANALFWHRPGDEGGGYVSFIFSKREGKELSKLQDDFQPHFTGGRRRSPFFNWQRMYRPIVPTQAGFREPLCITNEQSEMIKEARGLTAPLSDAVRRLKAIQYAFANSEEWPEWTVSRFLGYGDRALTSLAWFGSWIQDVHLTLRDVGPEKRARHPLGAVYEAFAEATRLHGIYLGPLVTVLSAYPVPLVVVNPDRKARLRGMKRVSGVRGVKLKRFTSVPFTSDSPVAEQIKGEMAKAQAEAKKAEAKGLRREAKNFRAVLPLLMVRLDQAIIVDPKRWTAGKPGGLFRTLLQQDVPLSHFIVSKQARAEFLGSNPSKVDIDEAVEALEKKLAALNLGEKEKESRYQFEERMERLLGRQRTRDGTPLWPEKRRLLLGMAYIYHLAGGDQTIKAFEAARIVLRLTAVGGGRAPSTRAPGLLLKKEQLAEKAKAAEERAVRFKRRLEAEIQRLEQQIQAVEQGDQRWDIAALRHALARAKSELRKVLANVALDTLVLARGQVGLQAEIARIQQAQEAVRRKQEKIEHAIASYVEQLADLPRAQRGGLSAPPRFGKGREGLLRWLEWLIGQAYQKLADAETELSGLEWKVAMATERLHTAGRGQAAVTADISAIQTGQSLQTAGGVSYFYTFNPVLFEITRTWWNQPGGPWEVIVDRKSNEETVAVEVADRARDVDSVGRYGEALRMVYTQSLRSGRHMDKGPPVWEKVQERLRNNLRSANLLKEVMADQLRIMETYGKSLADAAEEAMTTAQGRLERSYPSLDLLDPRPGGAAGFGPGGNPFGQRDVQGQVTHSGAFTEAKELADNTAAHLSRMRAEAQGSTLRYAGEATRLGKKGRRAPQQDLEQILSEKGIGEKTVEALVYGGLTTVEKLRRAGPSGLKRVIAKAKARPARLGGPLAPTMDRLMKAREAAQPRLGQIGSELPVDPDPMQRLNILTEVPYRSKRLGGEEEISSYPGGSALAALQYLEADSAPMKSLIQQRLTTLLSQQVEEDPQDKS